MERTGKDSRGDTSPEDNVDDKGRGKRYAVTVNGETVRIDDRTPNARQILRAADFNPADEHVLIEVLAKGTQSVGLDEIVDLKGGGRERYFAFASDRVFRFTMDSCGFEWGAPEIAESVLRDLGGVSDDEAIVLERADEPDHELGHGDSVVLSDQGTEHLRTIKGLVTVCIDGTEKDIPRGYYTAEKLLAVLGIAAGYLLNVITGQGELKLLEPGDKVRITKGMKFVSQVPCGGSS